MGRTGGRRGHTPVARVTAAHCKRVSLAALICAKPGQRPRLIYRTHTSRGLGSNRRKGRCTARGAALTALRAGLPVILVFTSMVAPGWAHRFRLRVRPSGARRLPTGRSGR
jgi:hypothetical protein